MHHTRLAALALAAASLAASGCGGSSKAQSEASSGGTLTRTELVAKANAICRHLKERASSTVVRTEQDIARVAPELASADRRASAELSKLTPPASMAGDLQQIVTGTRALADSTIKIGEYARANDLKKARKVIAAAKNANKRMVSTAALGGFSDCAQIA